MSILDELRLRANEKKEAQQQKETREQNLAGNYKHILLPKMQYIFSYFNELVANLNFLSEPVLIKDYSRRYPQLGDLQQSGYRINTDGFGGLADFNRITQVNLVFFLKGEGSFSYDIEGQRIIEQEVAFLHARDIPFDWKNFAGKPGIQTATFTIQRKIPVRFRMEVLYDTSQLKFTIDNHEDFSVYSKILEPDTVNDEFLENVVSYLLRRNHEFTKLDISEQNRQEIRNKLLAEERERMALMAQIKFEEEQKTKKHKK